MKFDMQDGAFMKEQMMAAKDMAMDAMRSKLGFAFAPQAAAAPRPPNPPVHSKAIAFRGRNMSDDRLYSARPERARQSPVGRGAWTTSAR